MQKKLLFIWSAFIYAVLIYMGIAFFLVDSAMSNPDCIPIVAGVTILLSVISAVMTVVIRMKLISAPMQDGRLDVTSELGFQKYQTISIINWALSESVAVFGLILVVVSGELYYAIPYCAVSLILLILHIPKMPSSE